MTTPTIESRHADRQTALPTTKALRTASGWINSVAACLDRLNDKKPERVDVSIFAFTEKEDGVLSLEVIETRSLPKTVEKSGYLGRMNPPRSTTDFQLLDELCDGIGDGYQLTTAAVRGLASSWANAATDANGFDLKTAAQAITIALALRSGVRLSGTDL